MWIWPVRRGPTAAAAAQQVSVRRLASTPEGPASKVGAQPPSTGGQASAAGTSGAAWEFGIG